MLTKEKLAELFCYEDGNLINKVQRGAKGKKGQKAGCFDKEGYVVIGIDKKLYRAHRLIWLMNYGEFPSGELDHINGKRDDNRVENLREATSSENKHNQKKRVTNTSGFKGVSFCKKSEKWIAFVTVNKKQKNFGPFDDVELADLVACEARNKYHKMFACNV
jgi:hypothetical protein